MGVVLARNTNVGDVGGPTRCSRWATSRRPSGTAGVRPRHHAASGGTGVYAPRPKARSRAVASPASRLNSKRVPRPVAYVCRWTRLNCAASAGAQFVTAQVQSGDTKPAVVAAAATRCGNSKARCRRSSPKRWFADRLVKIGRRGFPTVEVPEGLTRGEQYVSEGAFVEGRDRQEPAEHEH